MASGRVLCLLLLLLLLYLRIGLVYWVEICAQVFETKRGGVFVGEGSLPFGLLLSERVWVGGRAALQGLRFGLLLLLTLKLLLLLQIVHVFEGAGAFGWLWRVARCILLLKCNGGFVNVAAICSIQVGA